jgi:stage III sporulation protein AE
MTATIFGVFISVQGITSACHDGISFKIAKYTISNSVPIVGGFVKDGFELVILTSVLLKNAIGVISVFVLFSIVLSPIAYMIVFSLLLKFTAALTENVADIRISNFCTNISKCITYLCASVILVGFMLLITISLMILSANSIL